MKNKKSRSSRKKLKIAKRREENLMKLISEVNRRNNVRPEKAEEYNAYYSPLQGEYKDYCRTIEHIDRFLFNGPGEELDEPEEEDEDVIILPDPVTVPPEVRAREVNRV
jgi:hypothetical protein